MPPVPLVALATRDAAVHRRPPPPPPVFEGAFSRPLRYPPLARRNVRQLPPCHEVVGGAAAAISWIQTQAGLAAVLGSTGPLLNQVLGLPPMQAHSMTA